MVEPRPSASAPKSNTPSFAFSVKGRGLCLVVLLASLAFEKTVIATDSYKIGDRATNNISTPIELIVIDPEKTAELKEKEAARVSVICRYNTNADDVAEQKLRSTLDRMRDNFLNLIDTNYNRRKIGPQMAAAPKFSRLVASFQKHHKAFPLSTNLATVWAMGESDRVLRSSLIAALRESMARPIKPATAPPEARLTLTVRLIELGDWTVSPTLEQVERLGRNVQRTNIIGINRAREEIQQLFPEEERAMGRFLSTFVTTNCVADVELTQQARAKRTEPFYTADQYHPGQLIVTQGQVIDQKAFAALQALREKSALAAATPAVVPAPLPARASRISYLVIAGTGLLLVLGFATLQFWLAAKRRSLLPAVVPGDGKAELHLTSNHPELRQGLLPHLARMLMQTFVQKLISDRSQLLDSHQKALAELAELETRLEKIHAPLQDRLRAYEQRISELEKELARKGQENRELIKAKIEMIRHQLAAARDRLPLN